MNQDNVSHLSRNPRLAAVALPEFDLRGPSRDGASQPHKKFVAKGHDAQLQDAQINKLPTTITLISGAVWVGTVSKRDKFTITLHHAEGTPVAGMDEIFYKHAIEGVLIDRRPEAVAAYSV